jgi:hypothetical protein
MQGVSTGQVQTAFAEAVAVPFIFGRLVSFPSELIWNYGSYRHLVGLFGRGISPVARPLPAQDNTQKKRGVGFEPTIAVQERAKTVHALDRAASRATAQAASRRLSTAAARVRTKIRACGICGGQSGIRAVSSEYFGHPCQF